MNPLFEVIEPILLPLSFRGWNIVREWAQDLDLMSVPTESCNKDSDSQRWKRRKIVQVHNENATVGIAFEVKALCCN